MLNSGADSTKVRSVIIEEVRDVLSGHGHAVESIDDDSKLNANLGMTSLNLATLVAQLEQKLGIDPFAEMVSITSVRTIGDLVGAYVSCLNGETGNDHSSQLDQVAQRAKARLT